MDVLELPGEDADDGGEERDGHRADVAGNAELAVVVMVVVVTGGWRVGGVAAVLVGLHVHREDEGRPAEAVIAKVS